MNDADSAKPLAIAKFWQRRTPPVGPDYVTLRAYDGQENLHIDGEYALYRRTEGPDRDRLLEDLYAEILRWQERSKVTRDIVTDLAHAAERPGCHGNECKFCGAGEGHKDHCLWWRARLYAYPGQEGQP